MRPYKFQFLDCWHVQGCFRGCVLDATKASSVESFQLLQQKNVECFVCAKTHPLVYIYIYIYICEYIGAYDLKTMKWFDMLFSQALKPYPVVISRQVDVFFVSGGYEYRFLHVLVTNGFLLEKTFEKWRRFS